MLLSFDHKVFAYGKMKGEVYGLPIVTEWNKNWLPHTITLYINPTLQPKLYNQIIAIRPKRVVFNPGTENKEFEVLLTKNGIEVSIACTLVLLSTGQY